MSEFISLRIAILIEGVMLKNHLEMPYARDCRLHLYQIDDDIIPYNDPVYRPLTVGINGVTNSTEERINQALSFPHDGQKKSTGWLRCLLTGVAVLMGTGMLAAGGYFCYMAGRVGSTGNAIFPYSARSLDIAASPSVMQLNGQQIADDTTHIPIASRSPYSYYEDKNNTASISSDPALSENLLTTRGPEIRQQVRSGTIVKDNYYPLNSVYKKELAGFCLSNADSIVIKSYKAEPKYKCELLSEVIDKIFHYKEMYSGLRDMNSERKELTPEEKNNEDLMRRKLTILYLAAETIISGKETFHFYINAMRDDKIYPPEELIKREENIMSYFSAHHLMNEC